MLYYHTPRPVITAALLAVTMWSLPARADVPNVATDIAPVHSLVAQVMKGLGTPDLILPPGANPHGHALRPSEAAALERADLVVWIGHELTPWLEGPLTTLAASAEHRSLIDVEDTTLLPLRQGAGFEGHHHGHGHGHDEGHEHEEEHGNDDEHGHDEGHDAEHAEAHDEEHGHDEAHDHGDDHGADRGHSADHDDHGDDHGKGMIDPHAWLDPANAALWLTAIADELSALDPENATIYATNAAEGQALIADAQAEARALLTPLQQVPFVVMHDAYHYFEAQFGLSARAAISDGDANRPSPARLDAVRAVIATTGARCVLGERAANPGWVEAISPDGAAQAVVVDPLGTHLEPGAALYPALLQHISVGISECLGR